jgi:hypothetical protein
MVQWMLFLKLSGHSFDAQLYDQDVPAVKINWRSSNRYAMTVEFYFLLLKDF